jgi:tRNA pseudouridine55 synthase
MRLWRATPTTPRTSDARPVQSRIPREKRPVNGVLLFDKPTGITSQQAVSRLKRLFAAAKAGHTGTLDPMASGLLPICFGEATKFAHLLLDAEKTYAATIKLGVTTTTGDMEGEMVATAPVMVERRAVDAVLKRFVGEILQTPPMYSAVKHKGKPLYKYARAGIELPRAARRVRIADMKLLEYRNDELRIRVTCSKGTYIRALAHDIGRELGCGACLGGLRRTVVGSFTVEQAIAFEALMNLTLAEREALLLPVDVLVFALPRIDLDASQARKIAAGRPIEGPYARSRGLVRIYGPGQAYLGIAAIELHGALVPRRLMASAAST